MEYIKILNFLPKSCLIFSNTEAMKGRDSPLENIKRCSFTFWDIKLEGNLTNSTEGMDFKSPLNFNTVSGFVKSITFPE